MSQALKPGRTSSRTLTKAPSRPAAVARVRCVRAVARQTARKEADNKINLAPAVLATVLAFSTGAACLDVAYVPAARADEVVEEDLTPAQRRQREFEKRRELLRQAREAAEARSGTGQAVAQQAEEQTRAATAAVEDANAARRAEAQRLSADVRASRSSYDQQAAKSKLLVAPPVAAEAPSEPSGPSWWEAAVKEPVGKPKEQAPTAPPQAPQPAAAPVKVEVKREAPPAPKAVPAAAAQKPGKRRGPLPLWLVQLVLLGGTSALVVAVTKYQVQFLQATEDTKAKIVELYRQAEKALPAAK